MKRNFRVGALAHGTASLIMAVALTALSGCGYALVGRGAALPPDVKTVSIQTFANKSGEPALDILVTAAIRDEFTMDGRLRVDDSGGADSTLTGVIESYSLQPVAYRSTGEASEYNVNLDMTVTHKAARTDKTLIKQHVSVNWRYVAEGTITASESQRLLATKEAAKKAAETLLSLVIEAF